MSILTCLAERKGEGNGGSIPDDIPNLTSFTKATSYILPSGKECDLETVCKDQGNVPITVFTENERFVLNENKKQFLLEINFNVPQILFWFKPEFGVNLASKYALRQLTGVTDPAHLNHLVKNNKGVFNYLVPFFKISVHLYKYAGLQEVGIDLGLHRTIICALIEVINLEFVTFVKLTTF